MPKTEKEGYKPLFGSKTYFKTFLDYDSRTSKSGFILYFYDLGWIIQESKQRNKVFFDLLANQKQERHP